MKFTVHFYFPNAFLNLLTPPQPSKESNVISIQLMTKNYAQITGNDLELESSIVPRCGEIINVYKYRERFGLEKDFDFMVYEVQYYPENGELHAIVKCRQWFPGNKIEEIFGEELWWAKK